MGSKKFDYFFFVWMTVILLTVLAISVQDLFPWLLDYPKELVWPISDLLNFFMNLLVSYTGDFFLTVSWLLAFPIKAAQLQCDKHIVKMIVESAQMLCTAHRMLDGTFEKRLSNSES